MNLKERRDQLLAEAKAIVEKAKGEDRDLTYQELQTVEGKITEVKSINDDLSADAKSANILGQLDDMARGQDAGNGDRFLSFSKAWAAGAAEKVMPVGKKALAADSAVFIDAELMTTPIPMGRPATSLLNVLPVKMHDQPTFGYIRQSVRNNAAAVVPEGQTKPESDYTIIKIDNSLDIIAHLSQGVARYWFDDAEALKPFMEEELSYGLRLAVEEKVLEDIDATSGVQTQAFATNKLTTIRKCITKLEVLDFSPSAIVVHPLDWEEIELQLSADAAVEFRGLPYDPASRRLFGAPVVVANVATAGEARVLASGAVGVDTDKLGVRIEWTQLFQDDFATNKVRARCEGRFATSVFQPMGVVIADLTAA
ncbi:phage major capsid protein [Mycobacterium sp. IS-1556]|uniref:phage major capsid protein n=1 Tax=Mycobacterium sp. IS-1556 TaxID=1772276 RepID=UPI0007416045|nr:phage major capsid protein [Mycobacterium sp. IS-1556]KUH90631.1 hypothetical protein AU187_24475 [Mycobacterium sp. IS-1556]